MFEFTRFRSSDYQHGSDFVADLDRFLDAFPKGWPYAIEMRNKHTTGRRSKPLLKFVCVFIAAMGFRLILKDKLVEVTLKDWLSMRHILIACGLGLTWLNKYMIIRPLHVKCQLVVRISGSILRCGFFNQFSQRHLLKNIHA